MKSKGFGDTVHNAIRVVRKNAVPCRGCKSLEKWLNKILPYKNKK